MTAPQFEWPAVDPHGQNTDSLIRLMNTRFSKLSRALNAKQSHLDWINVRDSGAAGDGLHDDTAAITKAIGKLTTGAVLFFPPGRYRVSGAPTLTATNRVTVIGYGATIQLSGVGAYGLKFAGMNEQLHVYGLRVVGSGVTADDHQGLGNTPTPGVGVGGTGLVIRDVTVEDCTRGIVLDVGVTFDWANVLVDGCTILRTNGTSSGQGYGIVLSGVFGGRVRDCYVQESTRHGIYISAGDKHVVSGCTLYRHRFGIGTGGLFAALEIARCNDVTATDNRMIECTDGGMDVLPDESATRSVRNILVQGNTFIDSVNNDLHVGNQGPSTSGSFREILIADNTFIRPSGATNAGYAIRVFHGIGVTIRGNHFDGDRSFTITTAAIYLSAAEGATYTDRIAVEDNTGRYTASGGGFVAFLEVATSLAGASQSIRVVGNAPTLSGGAGSALILYDAAPTTTTLECWGNTVDDSGSTAIGPTFRAMGHATIRGDVQARVVTARNSTYGFTDYLNAYDGTNRATWGLSSASGGFASRVFASGQGWEFFNSASTLVAYLSSIGALQLRVAGAGLAIKEGSNATLGTATLVAGTVTVNTTKVTANSRIFFAVQVVGGTQGMLSLGTVTAGASFVINSSNAADTSTVAWWILEPA